MAITVKHKFVSAIPDSGDTTIVQPSNWNDTHDLTGTVPVANGGTGAATLTGYVKGNGTSTMTASSTIPNTDITGLGTASTKDAGVANGVATLDSSGQVPLSQIPPLGDLNYQGAWNANTNSPTLTSSVGTKGFYYVVSVAGTTNLNGITDWQVGDWAVFNGSVWQKIDNTDSVTSVNGYTGAVVLTASDIGGLGTMATQNANSVAITGGTATLTSLTTPIVQATNSSGLSLKNSAGTTQLAVGSGGGNNIALNVATNINPANAQVDISPTGTGTVRINPATASTMDNVVIGATTPKAITGTTITGTSFVGSGASLTNVVNSLAASTGISVSGSTGAVTVTNTAPDQTVVLTAGTGISTSGTYPNFTITNTSPSSGGTVTSVATGTGLTGGPITTSGTIALANTTVSAGSYTNSSITVDAQGRLTSASSGTAPVTSVSATSPVVSSGGTTPTISMAAANATTNGYLTSTDWNTFNNKQPAGSYLTAVTADAPLSGSGTSGSHLVISQANTSTNGYLTSTDWNTFNGKANAFTYTTNYIPYGQGTTTPLQSANHTFDGTTLTLGNAGVTARFQGDFSNATVASRTAFVTGTTNGSTGIYALPNGTSTAASWQATNNSSPTNASKILIATNGSTDVQLVSGINGTGTYLPLTFWNNGAEKARLSVAGGFSVGTASDAGSTNILAAGNVTGAQVVASNGLMVNSNTVAASYSIPSGSSAMSAGPMTVASGQSVTIPSGSRWVVL